MKIGGVPEHFNYPWRVLEKESGAFEWVDMHGGTGQIIKDLEEGEIDAAILLSEGLTFGIDSGKPLSMIDIWVESSLKWGVHAHPQKTIEELLSKPSLTFTVSRMGSGSHLMAFQFKKLFHYNGEIDFVVGGNLEGCIEQINENEADLFLWEKYTTRPYVDAAKLSYNGDVPTPWPAFSIATRKGDEEKVKPLIEQARKTIAVLESQKDLREQIALKYELGLDLVHQWKSELTWCKEQANTDEVITSCRAYLKENNL